MVWKRQSVGFPLRSSFKNIFVHQSFQENVSVNQTSGKWLMQKHPHPKCTKRLKAARIRWCSQSPQPWTLQPCKWHQTSLSRQRVEQNTTNNTGGWWKDAENTIHAAEVNPRVTEAWMWLTFTLQGKRRRVCVFEPVKPVRCSGMEKRLFWIFHLPALHL